MQLPQPIFEVVNGATAQELNKYNALVLPVYIRDESATLEQSQIYQIILAKSGQSFAEVMADWPDFKAKPGEMLELPLSGHGKLSRLYIVGFGTGSIDDARKAGAAIGRKVKSKGFRVYNSFTGQHDVAVAHIVAISLSQYGWSLKSSASSADVSARAKGATRVAFDDSLAAAVARAKILADATWTTRNLIHTPSNIKTPAWLAEQAKSLVRKSKSADLSVKVKKGRELAKFGGLRAVGNSSPSAPPHLIEVRYEPAGSANWPHVVLVGKGITYDTGGISLKRPYEIMVPMKSDMAGAAAILAATVAMAEVKPKVRITALMMCAQNMVSGTAQRPSDVITHYGGTTVEVINTDAEGRLVLADGLAYADLELDPDYLLDIATLTGAATLGLGRQYAAMYSRNSALTARLHEVGDRIGDAVWPMPLVDEYKPALKSPVADFNHDASAKKFGGGSITAALFLEHFAGKRNWVHLDIAGPARSDVDSGELVKGGTGFGARLIIEWLATLA